MVTRHEFLAMLHKMLQPRGYLEVGVQFGDSLRLANCPAIGIDPAPQLQGHFPGGIQVFTMTSDEFFHQYDPLADLTVPGWELDLAFIDGMHLYEYALRDFQNIQQYANPRTVIVFDDVMPRNQHEAAREQCPGDWTGDVWKTARLIEAFRRDLKTYWVDTFPTGTFVVYGFDPGITGHDTFRFIENMGLEGWQEVPDDVINRSGAVTAEWALEQITTYIKDLEPT